MRQEPDAFLRPSRGPVLSLTPERCGSDLTSRKPLSAEASSTGQCRNGLKEDRGPTEEEPEETRSWLCVPLPDSCTYTAGVSSVFFSPDFVIYFYLFNFYLCIYFLI